MEDREGDRREWRKEKKEKFEDRRKDDIKDKAPRPDIRNIDVKDKSASLRYRKPSRGEVFVSAQVRAEAAAEESKDNDDLDLFFGSFGTGVVMLPYKPLLSAKFGLLTLDVKKTYTLAAKIDFYRLHEPCRGVLIVRQDRIEADLYTRTADWRRAELRDPADRIAVADFGYIGALGQLYRHTPLWQSRFDAL